jgi:hypothetical protein
MSLKKLIASAAQRMEVATAKITETRNLPPTQANLVEWMEALTDYTLALTDLVTYNNESAHEKIQEISARTKLGPLGPG